MMKIIATPCFISMTGQGMDKSPINPACPKAIRTDHGLEFTGKTLYQWNCQHGVQLIQAAAGKPMQNAFIERFNGRFRDDCLNAHSDALL